MNTTYGGPESDLETRLRAEYAHRAAAATGADAILAALADPRPTALRPYRDPRSTGRWIAVAAGVAIIAAGVPIGLHLAGGNPATGPAAGHQHDTSYALTFRPAWLPSGYVASQRESSLGGLEQDMTWNGPIDWKNPQVPPKLELEVDSTATPYGKASAESSLDPTVMKGDNATTINGHPAAVMNEFMGYTTITWQPSPDVVLTASSSGLGDALPTVKRMAESVVPDNSGRATVTAGLAFGTLPDGYHAYAQEADGIEKNVSARTIRAAYGSATDATHDLNVQWNPKGFADLPSPEGTKTPITVRGQAGSYIVGKDESALVVNLADGSRLTVESTPLRFTDRPAPPRLTKEQLIAVANGIVIDPDPDVSWLGH